MTPLGAILCGLIGFALIATTSQAGPHEKYYQQQWCAAAGGEQEVRLEDGTRVDCLTSTHAIEFDFAHKWAESISQAKYYAIKTNKLPGVVLILGPNDQRFLDRLITINGDKTATIWTIDKIQ